MASLFIFLTTIRYFSEFIDGEDYRELGEGLWSRFNAPKEDQLWFYGEMIKTLQQTAVPKPLVDELGLVVGN
jgi:hypothetical protein